MQYSNVIWEMQYGKYHVTNPISSSSWLVFVDNIGTVTISFKEREVVQEKTGGSRGKTCQGNQDVQVKWIMSSISFEVKPCSFIFSLLSCSSSGTSLSLHCSLSGALKYSNFFFTRLAIKCSMSSNFHCLHKELRVLPITVLTSFSQSLASNLIGSLELFWRDLQKLTYLDDSITLGCMVPEIISTK